MRISILVPCYNEERSLEATIRSCLNQTRYFDELIFVDDSSTDRTPEILLRYADRITVRRTVKNTGNKSSAQEFGLQFVTGDIFVTTDADTLLDSRFCEEVERNFNNEDIFAVVGYVKSIPYNWLTLCRAFEYAIGQNIHKLAQSYMRYIFVMPGAASAFRTDGFRKYISFDHDTITEDLDFTYKMHLNDLEIEFNTNAVCYTQDPITVKSYLNQMRRWFGGGWQNLKKHRSIIFTKPSRAFELSLVYAEGLVFSVLIFILPFLNAYIWLLLLLSYLIIASILSLFAAYTERRWTLILVPIPYIFIVYVNSYVYLEQFVKEIILRRKNLIWFKPERINTQTS
jgi:cellulose synthase/poly-beta-1,6-N-acetylglucosamine synthase-like glycosyltransferase